MTIGFPGHSAPAAGFEVPLEMLAACHSRAEHQCSTLRRLVEHLVRNAADADARMAAVNVMRYFDTSANDHPADEEQDPFPALLASAVGSEAMALSDLTGALAAFIQPYERHIAREESELLPVAKRILSELELDRVGRSMRERHWMHVIDGLDQQASRVG